MCPRSEVNICSLSRCANVQGERGRRDGPDPGTSASWTIGRKVWGHPGASSHGGFPATGLGCPLAELPRFPVSPISLTAFLFTDGETEAQRRGESPRAAASEKGKPQRRVISLPAAGDIPGARRRGDPSTPHSQQSTSSHPAMAAPRDKTHGIIAVAPGATVRQLGTSPGVALPAVKCIGEVRGSTGWPC